MPRSPPRARCNLTIDGYDFVRVITVPLISEFEGVAGPSYGSLYVGMRSGGGRVARACINGERRRAISVCPRSPGDGLGISERTLGPILATRQTPPLMDMEHNVIVCIIHIELYVRLPNTYYSWLMCTTALYHARSQYTMGFYAIHPAQWRG